MATCPTTINAQHIATANVINITPNTDANKQSGIEGCFSPGSVKYITVLPITYNINAIKLILIIPIASFVMIITCIFI